MMECPGYYGGAGGYHGPGWFGVVAGLFLLGLLAALVALGIWAATNRGAHRQDDPALAALRLRLATGEISQEEYEKIRTLLG